MGIIFNEDNKLFHIQSKRTSYILSVLETGHLINLYWGRKINSNKINYVVKKNIQAMEVRICVHLQFK